VELDATTNRTLVCRYRWDENGRRILTEVLEEDSHTTPSGDTRVERRISSADVNGDLRIVRRETADTTKIGADVEDWPAVVMSGPSVLSRRVVGEDCYVLQHLNR
jgi:hypothetical protein